MNRCDVCGKRYEDPDWGVAECPRCKAAQEAIGNHWYEISEWVQAVAEKAAHDEVLRHENEEDHS